MAILKIPVRGPDQTLDMVREVERLGLVRNQDFTWGFIPGWFETDSYSNMQSYAEFYFCDEKMLLFFQMRWL